MLKSKLAKAFMLSVCISIFSAAAVNAAVTEKGRPEDTAGGGGVGITMGAGSPDEAVSSPAVINQEMIKKQSEIDKYLIIEHLKEIEAKGITITHTAPFDTYVEIGIMPLNDENSEYMYDILGKDQVKVVDGQKVITMSPMGTPEPAPDVAAQGNAAVEPEINAEIYNAEDVKSGVENEAAAGAAEDGLVYRTTSEQEDEQRFTTTAAVPENVTEKNNSTLLIKISAAGAIVILGGAVLLLRRRKPAVR